MMLLGKNTFTYFTTCMYKARCKYKLHLQRNTWSTNGETVKPYRATNFEPCNTFEHSTPTMHNNQLRNALSICWRSNCQGYLSLSAQKRLQSICQGDQNNSKAYSAVETALRQDARMKNWITESEPETLDGHSWVPNGLAPFHLFLFASLLIPIDPHACRKTWNDLPHNFKGARPSMNRNPMWIIAMA